MGSHYISFAPASCNLLMPLANTEYTLTIPSGVKRLTFQCRTSEIVRYAWEPGHVAGSVNPFISLKADMVFNEIVHIIKARPIYVASTANPLVLEFDYWF